MNNLLSLEKNIITESEVRTAVDKWGSIIAETFGITDKERLKWMSVYAETHKNLELQGKVDFGILTESIWNWTHLNPGMNVQTAGPIKLPTNATAMSTTGAGSGDMPITILPLAMQVAAQTIGFDLVPVVQLKGPMGMLQYRDVVYGGGNLPVPGGPDGRVAPLIVEIKGFPSDIFLTKNGVYYAGRFDNSGGGPTFEYWFKLTFIDYSRITGNPIFKVETSTDISPKSATNYSNNLPTFIIGYDNGKTLADVFAASVATNIGIADISGSDIVNIISTNNTEPRLVEALNNHIPGFSGRALRLGNDVTDTEGYEREEAESTPSNSLGVKLFTKIIKVKDVKVRVPVTRQQIQDYKAFGFDVLSDIESILVNETTQTINKDILDKLYRLGNLNAYQIEKTTKLNLSLVVSENADTGSYSNINVPSYWAINKFPKGSDEDINNVTYLPGFGNLSSATDFGLATPEFQSTMIKPSAGDNVGTLQRLILGRILTASNLIQVRGRRGPATFAVVSGLLASAIQNIAGFVPYPLSNNISQQSGTLYPLGSLAGITIYVDPNLDFGDMTVLVGRKGDGKTPGLIFCPYILADAVQTVAEQTMAPVIEMLSRYALVEAGFYPQLYYYTFKVLFDNKSLV